MRSRGPAAPAVFPATSSQALRAVLVGGLLTTFAPLPVAPALASPSAFAPGSPEGNPTQETPRLAVAVRPSEVEVGEPFTLGVTVRAAPGTEVTFPAWLVGGEHLEQLAAAEIRSEGNGTIRAYYRLTAWKAGEWPLPAFAVSYGAPGATSSLAVTPPSVSVRSVLPAYETELELRGARPLLQAPGRVWPWVLAAVVALVAAWGLTVLLRRRRRAPGPAPAPAVDAVDRALSELEALRRGWISGELDGATFYDGWETTLRGYARSTRGWSPGEPLSGLADGDVALARCFGRSALVRFAGLGADAEGPRAAADAAIAWVRTDVGRAGSEGAEMGGER